MINKPSKPIYLDYAATTPLCEAAFLAMKPYFTVQFGNANSLHSFGSKAAAALYEARRTVADCIGAKAEEIFFTSCGTESNNWAVKGIAHANAQAGKKRPHIVTSSIEHPSVLQSAARLEQDGFSVTRLAVDQNGLVSEKDLKEAILPETCLVSLMLANNEIGTVQPVKELAAIARAHGIPFHTDAVQAAGTLALDVKKLGVDLMTLSAHKFYGPKGIGALYIRSGLNPRPEPLIEGGQQERGQRGGTSNTAAAVGMAAALKRATDNLKPNYDKVRAIRDYFVSQIEAHIPQAHYNGCRENRLPQNANFSFLGIGAAEMIAVLDLAKISVASGSACSSGSTEPSHVLTALGVPLQIAKSAIRFSFSPDTTRDEVDYTVEQIKTARQKILNVQS